MVEPEVAATTLFNDPKAEIEFEPATEADADLAIEAFQRLFAAAPGVFKEALEGARAGAEILSADRLQGLAELLQNADDAGATVLRFQLFADRLVVCHDGRPVHLSDVLALATPWVSNKGHESESTGRFGIGLMTLRALSPTLDVHSGPYHLRLGDPSLMPIPSLDGSGSARSETTFVVPLVPGGLSLDDVDAWLRRWDDAALLFCRHVKRVALLDASGNEVRVLRLEWSEPEMSAGVIASRDVILVRRLAAATDGRRWYVHTAQAPAPTSARRQRKATAATVELAVAVGADSATEGLIYAGLPLVHTSAPVRLNAPFDPVTSRRDLADTPWNRALIPLITELWAIALADLFRRSPPVGWHGVPLPRSDLNAHGPVEMAERLSAELLAWARAHLADDLRIAVDGSNWPVGVLATEAVDLERALSATEVAALADAPASLPAEARDEDGRWRAVLADWRAAGAHICPEVNVEQALVLLEDEGRTAGKTVALMAAGLRADLEEQVAAYRCVLLADGSRIEPPTDDSIDGLLMGPSPLAEQLGVGHLVHRAFLEDDEDATAVLGWLRQRGALIEGNDGDTLVRRLAAAGNAGRQLADVLSDEQADALRTALEAMSTDERGTLGRAVGAAIRLRAFTYDARGRRVDAVARPVDAYLPKAIDREQESFAFAADKTPGLLWLHNGYAELLRSSLGRSSGLGAQRFLRLLGAEIAPRLVSHDNLAVRFSGERRLGLPADTPGSPLQRRLALQALGASYSLDDYDSPDLRAVAANIGKERAAKRRRARAAALIASLGRGWDRLADYEEVSAADDYYSWQLKGDIKAFWLWATGAVPWLDDTGGTPRPPLELRLRTPATIAVHGSDAGGYLRPEFDALNRRDVLSALGVSGEPSSRDLIARLKDLRADDSGGSEDEVAVASAIYVALADRWRGRRQGHGDLSDRELRTVFSQGSGLIRARRGWLPPSEVLSGPPIFGSYRDFVPPVRDAEPLWNALHVRAPSIDDAIDVLGKMARRRGAPEGQDAAVHLESLRLIAERISGSVGKNVARRLSGLPLWTSQGWKRERPVFAIDDPILVAGVGNKLPVWLPGGELDQFIKLLAPLRIRELSDDADFSVESPNSELDEEATELLQLAVPLLRDDLARNEPAASASITLPWTQLEAFEVRTDPALSVRVAGVDTAGLTVPVSARVEVGAGVVLLRDSDSLPLVDEGGRAIAALFRSDRRRIAHAWLAACVAAEHGRRARSIQLAHEVADELSARSQAAMERLREQTESRHAQTPDPTVTKPVLGRSKPHAPKPTTSPPRTLVDPSRLRVVNPDGGVEATGGTSHSEGRPRRNAPLPDPDPSGRAPRPAKSAPSFTALDKETVGLEIVRRVLAADEQAIVDLRAQHGVGADAVDELGRFFELKVYLGDEPDSIKLEESQIRRAMTTPDFFLVVVSGIEGAKAKPKVRIISNPVHQLQIRESSSVTFGGVRSAEHSLVYELALEPGEGDEQR